MASEPRHPRLAMLDQEWFVLGPPWGDGSAVVAGNPDPHRGTFVVDCELLFDSSDSIHERAEYARELAAHIVSCHNKVRAARMKVDAVIRSAGGS